MSRRKFLQASTAGAAGALTLGLDRLAWWSPGPATARALGGSEDYADWQDVYRKRWRWDRVVRGTHTNVNCVSSCAWNLYVREGVVFREEQSAPYVASNRDVPDWNPRGCQKGASCSDLLVGPTRLRHPMRRVGPRGSGRWKRISWDEAFDQIADSLVETLERRGGEGVLCELGPNIDFGPNSAAALRFFRQIGAPLTDSMGQIGDLPVGGTITLGTPHTDGTSDDWFRSRYLVLWACNPAATRIPDAHYLQEARYGGARIVCIAPDYNQSAIHADLWLSPLPGTDAALAMASCQVIVEEKLFDEAYIREQTDLPFLLRNDTGRFLRESDVTRGGREDVFGIWDETADQLHWAPGSQGSSEDSLALPDNVRPALEGERKVQLHDGRSVAVHTVFSKLRKRLDREHKPAQASEVTGINADLITQFARDFAAAPSALVLSQWGACKNYHSDLLQRSQILLASLTGNLGRAGGGWRGGAFIGLDGMALVAIEDDLSLLSVAWLAARSFVQPEAVRRQFETMYVPSTILHAVHGGLGEVATAPEHGDPALPEGSRPYLDKALAAGHFPVVPAPGEPSAEVIFSFCGNVLRHTRRGERVRDTLFANANLIVDIDFRLSQTGRYSDILLPAAGWYEKIGIKYIAAFVPYITLGDQATAPLASSKPEWEIYARLAERVAAKARERGVESTRGFRGDECSLSDLGKRFTDDGRFPADGQEQVLEFILSVSSASRGVSLEDLRRDGGAVRIRSLGPEGGTSGIYSPYELDEPVVPLRDFVEGKRSYPTLTGRQQFYIDHEWFLELGEELPTYKPPPTAGGDYPFTLTGGHTRWSIHAMWRDHVLMQRLERGEPTVLINDRIARDRGVADHDLVRVSNDLGAFLARARPTAAIRPEQVHMFHGWEPYQFRGGKSHQSIAPSPFKVTQLVGDYGHLHWAYAHYEPNQVDRDTRVEIERAEDTA
ncbi:MAG: molybdopterin-dependent oxidoreductase [bacterium]|nr:molybdopterin-dependent oxidoreductase [bacterium]MCP5040976.1 molybdopterin-dependent oxidoreductase [bacterium]